MTAELLRRAAAKLRDGVRALPPHMDGHWFTRSGSVVADDGTNVGVLVVEPYLQKDDEGLMPFIASMNPPVALALADWLDAVEYDRSPSRCADPQCGDSTWDHECDPRPVVTPEGGRALAVARAVLREEAS